MAQTMTYMLRKTLISWRMEETIEEVRDYCLANHVTEVMWKIDSEAFNRGFTSLDLIGDYLPHLKRAKKQFDQDGITTSINPWMTLNHADYGRDSRDSFPQMQWMVNYTGEPCNATACPLSMAFHDHLIGAYCLYAQVRPRILWVEDDLRHFNHPPAEWGCFCDLHLNRFSQIVGETLSREELVKCILQPGRPHPYRALWLDFQGAYMVDLAARLESGVHSVSPETRLGLMSSRPQDHATEGRRWYALIEALAGPHPGIVRPYFGPYQQSSPFDLFFSNDMLHQTAHCLPSGTVLCPELENVTFTPFVKTVRQTRLQLLLAAVAGCSDTTLNLYDHVGTPLSPDDDYGLMLRHEKAHLDGILKYCRPGGINRGVGLLFAPEISRYTHAQQGDDYRSLYDWGQGWSHALQALGCATTYGASDVLAITGQITRGYSEQQIRELLSRGVLLDGSAAQTLIEDGYGRYIGVDIETFINKPKVPIAAEAVGEKDYISPRSATHKEMLAQLHLHKGARASSCFVDYDHNVFMPAMVLFENELGGRIAVYAMDLHEGITCCFLSWKRQKQFQGVVRWLTRGAPPLLVSGGPYGLPLQIDYADYTIIAVVNTSTDEWSRVAVECSGFDNRPREVLQLKENGTWESTEPGSCCISEGVLSLSFEQRLQALDLTAFCLNH